MEEQPKSTVLPRSISLIKALTLPVIFIVLVEILVRNGVIEPYLLPAPSSLFQSLLNWLRAIYGNTFGPVAGEFFLALGLVVDWD